MVSQMLTIAVTSLPVRLLLTAACLALIAGAFGLFDMEEGSRRAVWLAGIGFVTGFTTLCAAMYVGSSGY
jgi:hypothetical protein